MHLSNRQKQMLHAIPRALGIDEPLRRMIQWNVGGFHSAADRTVSRQGFIAVMAFYESRSASSQMVGFTRGYWAEQDRLANPEDPLRVAVRQAATAVGMRAPQLDAWIAGPRMSSGACMGIDDCNGYWLRRALEGLKLMRRRGWRAGV